MLLLQQFWRHSESRWDFKNDTRLDGRPTYDLHCNPLIIKPGMVFFMHMILMDSKAQLAMNLGETYLVTETGNERLGKQKLDLVVL